VSVKRDAGLIAIEQSVRLAIRDAVNRSSRKPFAWGGVAGYDQLTAISQALHRLPIDTETSYLRHLICQIDRALEVNQALADDVGTAQKWLCRIADCLHYPPDQAPPAAVTVSSREVRQAMNALLAQFRPDPQEMPAQAALECAWHRLWKAWSSDLLACYDVPGLPADNLHLEAFFNRIRKHERRISGRASTRPLGWLGAYQVLLIAESEHDLLEGLRQVALVDYQTHRQRLAQRESPRQQRYRLHHDPAKAIQSLLDQHTARRAAIAATGPSQGT
jgi:hypothetical protein